jgi:hypothetical protein
MKSRALSLLVCFVVMCSLSGALSGCGQPDSPPPAKPTETPAAPTEKETQPHKNKEGKAYGSGELYKKSMRKPGT